MSKILEFVEFPLQPIAKEIPLNIRDTNNFLQETKTIDYVLDETCLVTVDFRSFCTNIQTSGIIVATKRALDKKTDKAVLTKFLTTFLVLILFNCINYQQIKSCAMHSICPSDANIFRTECSHLTMAFTGKFVYIAHHFILLQLNPFDLSVDRDRWWSEHSVS